MLKDVVEAELVGDHRLRLRFEDGAGGEVDLSTVVPFEDVFAPLRDPAVIAAVHVNRELGTIGWLDGADLDPDVFYALVQGNLVPRLSQRARVSRA